MLAWQIIKKEEEKHTIHGTNCINLKTKAQRDLDNFLTQANLPIISEPDTIYMDKNISLGELEEAINILQNGESPCNEGFRLEFYRHPKLLKLM